MEGTEYPIEHFELMTKVANYLRSEQVQMLEHEYRYKTFGSWWFVIQIRGENFRIVCDGRDGILRLDRNRPGSGRVDYNWVEVSELAPPDSSNLRSGLFERVNALVEIAMNIRFDLEQSPEATKR